MFVNNFGHQFCYNFFQGIPCLFDDIVMEVVSGHKNLMHFLVPQEKMKLRNADHLPISQGLKMILNRHGFDVKPETVSSKVAFLNVDMKCFVISFPHLMLHINNLIV
jgi:hypothetical protein